MNPIQRMALAWRRRLSDPGEKGEYSGGWLPGLVRKEVAGRLKGAHGRLLDIGCGEGLFLTQVSRTAEEVQMFGLDPWEDILSRTREKTKRLGLNRLQLTRGTALKLPFPDDTFEFVTLLNLTINLPDREATTVALAEAMRVARPAGSVYADFRNRLNPMIFFGYMLSPMHDPEIKVPLNSYTPGEMRGMWGGMKLARLELSGLGMGLGLLSPVILAEAVKR